jgi:hypothetical protein
MRVSGTARRGTRPAEGFRVVAHSDQARIPARTDEDAVAEATVDEEGEYELTLWKPGDYVLLLSTPKGVAAKVERLDFLIGDEVVDFQIDEAAVFGRVEDENGRALAEATVGMTWWRERGRQLRLAPTAEDGSFSFPMETDGPVDLHAARQGYTPSEPLSLRFVSGQPLGPLVLVLREEPTLRGVVVNGAGAPLPSAGITVLSATMSGHRAHAVSEADGRFEVVLPEGLAHQGLVRGPGCPLTPFVVPPPSADGDRRELRLACADAPASLALRVLDASGAPLPGAALILRTSGFVVPHDVLASHLVALGMPAQTDGRGRLVAAGLAAGTYDVYLASATNLDLVALGTDHGHLGTFSLHPSTLSQAEARLAGEVPMLERPPRPDN